MKPPENAKELKTFLGFIQYLGTFMPNMATESAPLRELLEKNVAWHWDLLQEESFQKLKQMASSTQVLGYYDPRGPLCPSLDASSKGLGAVLLRDEKFLAYVCIKSPHANQGAVCTNRKQNPCDCVWSAEISSVHLWNNNRRRDRPQAIAIHLKQALREAPLRLQKMMLILQW